MQILVVGCGSIGVRHIRNLRALGVAEIGVVDPRTDRVNEAVGMVGARPYRQLDEGLACKPDAVLVCTPPYLHLEGARAGLLAGAHVFIEKPFSHSLEGVDELLALAEQHHRFICVGYNLRFHPGVQKLKMMLDSGAIGRLLVVKAEFGQYLPDWRPTQDYRESYTARAELGGGIILDASHEIDYVRWLGGEAVSVYAESGKLNRLEMEAEDTAAMTLRLKEGVIAEIHADCTQRGYTRNCKLIGTEGTLTWDYDEGVRYYRPDKGWETFEVTADPNDMYLNEMRHFLACVRDETQPLVAGSDGRRVLEIALAARQSSVTGQRVQLN